jgi:hypothetical protein
MDIIWSKIIPASSLELFTIRNHKFVIFSHISSLESYVKCELKIKNIRFQEKTEGGQRFITNLKNLYDFFVTKGKGVKNLGKIA